MTEETGWAAELARSPRLPAWLAPVPPSRPPKVYCWCNSGAGTDIQVWYAMAEDGEVVTAHICSHESFARTDLIDRKHDLYDAKFGGHQDGVHFLSVWEVAPTEVYERNQALAALSLPASPAENPTRAKCPPAYARVGTVRLDYRAECPTCGRWISVHRVTGRFRSHYPAASHSPSPGAETPTGNDGGEA